MEANDKNRLDGYRRGRILSGLILILIGATFFARKLGVVIPDWIFTWPMFLIALGFYVGAKHNFKNPGWAILVGIGVVFLAERLYPEVEQIHEFFWPVLIMVIGVFVMVKPRRNKYKWSKYGNENNTNAYDPSCMVESETSENRIEITAIMGGVRKNVLSKDFKGGEINCVMGGAEVNLTQADFQGKVVLEINNIFGGTKLLIPANWEVISDMAVVLGGVEDKRPISSDIRAGSEKILQLKGSCIFGGVDIKSY